MIVLNRRLKALFSYVPEQEDELRLEIGDVVEYIADVEEGWWRGKLRGKVGIFPSNFVADADAEGTGSNNGPAKLPPEAAAKKSDDANKPLNSSANSTSFGKGKLMIFYLECSVLHFNCMNWLLIFIFICIFMYCACLQDFHRLVCMFL